MVRSIAELQRDIEPARDLWPGIAARLEAGASARDVPAAAPRTYARVARVPAWLAGAALASVVVLAFGMYWQAREVPHGASALTAGLPAEAQAGVEEGLAVIRDSRRQIEAALAADSGNPELQAMLVGSLYEESRVMWLVADAGQLAGVP